REFTRVYLQELNGALLTGLKGCSTIDDVSIYCPQYDFHILSYVINAVLGENILHYPEKYIDRSVWLRTGQSQSFFSEALNVLLSDIADFELSYSRQLVQSIEQLRRRILGHLAIVLPKFNVDTHEITDKIFERATDMVVGATDRFRTNNRD